MAPPNRLPVRRPADSKPPAPRSDTVPEQPVVEAPELSVSGRRRVARRAKAPIVKKTSRAPLLLGALVVVALGLAAAWKVTAKPPGLVVVDPSIETGKRLQAQFQEGKNLVRQGKWAEARAKFAAVLEQQPGFGEGAVQTYLAAAEKEIPNQKHLDDAAAAIEHAQVAAAHRALEALSADTQQLTRRDELQTRLTELFKHNVAEGQALAGSQGDVAKMKKLRSLAEDLLVRRPDDRDALEFKATAERALRPHSEHVAELPKDDPGLGVVQLYVQGDAVGALAAAAACANEAESCRQLQSQLSELNALLKRLESLQPAELDTALRLERGISGGKPTPQGKPIATRLAAVYYPRASAARTKGDWPGAMGHALKVVDADPAHAGALAIVAEGKERARELFLRCYQQRGSNPDEAVPLCTEVVMMLPAGDSQREKAQKVLDSLRAR